MRFFRRLSIVVLLTALVAVSLPCYAVDGDDTAGTALPDPESSSDVHSAATYRAESRERFERFSFSSFSPIINAILPAIKGDDVIDASYDVADYVDDADFDMLKVTLSGRVIGIDPGHQSDSDESLEPFAPDSDRLKTRQSAGCTGARSGVPESTVNLLVGFMLRDMLESCGATVVMTREENDVSISNAERAATMNASNVEIWLRLHCDSSSDKTVRGAAVLVPCGDYCEKIMQKSELLGACVLNSFSEATDVETITLVPLDDQTGFNFSASPVIALEMGYLSSPLDDVKLNRESYQLKISLGVINGICDYFELLPSLAADDQGEIVNDGDTASPVSHD